MRNKVRLYSRLLMHNLLDSISPLELPPVCVNVI